MTLVYGEDFVLAARVLGQSLRESGTKKWVGHLARYSSLPGFASYLAMASSQRTKEN